MKALSILQPYAWLIVTGTKDIENRTWTTGYRGPVLIHAGKNYAKQDYADDAEQYEGYPAREDMIGGIVGIATIADCVSTSRSRWFNGPYGFVLTGARRFPKLIPMRGALGFFDVPEEVLAQLPEGWNLSRAEHRQKHANMPGVRLPLTLADNEDRAGRIPGEFGYQGPQR